jgi:hypothetical protein
VKLGYTEIMPRVRFRSETYAAEWMSSLRNRIESNCKFGTYRAPATRRCVPNACVLRQYSSRRILHDTGPSFVVWARSSKDTLISSSHCRSTKRISMSQRTRRACQPLRRDRNLGSIVPVACTSRVRNQGANRVPSLQQWVDDLLIEDCLLRHYSDPVSGPRVA